MKILVTGANGYIGKHVINYLLNNYSNIELFAIDVVFLEIDSRVNIIKMDIFKDNDSLLQHHFDLCIHLAWRNGFDHCNDSHINDLPFHYAFLKKLVKIGCTNISVIGTMHEIGYFEGKADENVFCNPISPYGIAKNSLRQLFFLLNNENLSLKWLRAYYIMGDDRFSNSIFSKIIKMDEKKESHFPFTDGLNQHDFINIDTLSEQIVKASLQKEVNGIINICSGKPVSLKEKVEEFICIHKLSIKPLYGVYPKREYDSPCIWGDNSKISKIVNNKN